MISRYAVFFICSFMMLQAHAGRLLLRDGSQAHSRLKTLHVISVPKRAHWLVDEPVTITAHLVRWQQASAVRFSHLSKQLRRAALPLYHKPTSPMWVWVVPNVVADHLREHFKQQDVIKTMTPGLIDQPIVLDWITKVNYLQAKPLGDERVVNAGFRTMRTNLLLTTQAKSDRLSIELADDRVISFSSDPLPLPLLVTKCVKITVPFSSGQAIIIGWQHRGIDWHRHDDHYFLFPELKQQLAILQWRGYPQYFTTKTEQGHRLAQVLRTS